MSVNRMEDLLPSVCRVDHRYLRSQLHPVELSTIALLRSYGNEKCDAVSFGCPEGE